jgi:hypothetical protein
MKTILLILALTALLGCSKSYIAQDEGLHIKAEKEAVITKQKHYTDIHTLTSNEYTIYNAKNIDVLFGGAFVEKFEDCFVVEVEPNNTMLECGLTGSLIRAWH